MLLSPESNGGHMVASPRSEALPMTDSTRSLLVTPKHPALARPTRFIGTLAAVAALIFVSATAVRGQPQRLPNPYRLVPDWPSLPKTMNMGRWGELIRADIDPKGHIWVFHRCFNT